MSLNLSTLLETSIINLIENKPEMKAENKASKNSIEILTDPVSNSTRVNPVIGGAEAI